MDTSKNKSEAVLNPAMYIDETLDANTQDGLIAIDTLIRQDPELAARIVALYGKGSEVADQWLALLSDGEAKRYPFRLTAALGQTASRKALRYVSYDPQTEKAIAENQDVKELIAKTRIAPTKDAKAEAATTVGYTRLSIYAGALATAQSQKKQAATPASAEAATA